MITMVLVVMLASKMVWAVVSLAKLVSLVTGDIKHFYKYIVSFSTNITVCSKYFRRLEQNF